MGLADPLLTKGIVGLCAARERGDVDRQFKTHLTVTRDKIDRLGLEKELHGHMGCVNCLEWNHDGSILASASDDLHVILWDPFKYKILNKIPTGHTGNIFSVKFMSGDTIATCAADGTVRARTLCGGATLLECACHCGRVKRLATPPDSASLLWSAGEDGLVLQHDLRTSHRCNQDNGNVFVNLLDHMGRYAEAKCVAVNPRRPYQLAVGANDIFVRLYDIRMIKLSQLRYIQNDRTNPPPRWAGQSVRWQRIGLGNPEAYMPRSAIQYYTPGHLNFDLMEHVFPKKATTYVAFSDDGNELLVNMGSEQIYLFDLNSAHQPVLVESVIIQHNRGNKEGGQQDASSEGGQPGGDSGRGEGASKSQAPLNGTNGRVTPPQPPLPDRVRQIKEEANELVNKGNYSDAVDFYNEAISECPDCAILYSNRAAALMRRGWAGDVYAAIRDCYAAIRLDPNHVKSHFRLAKGLMDLRKPREALECLLYFKDRFPRHASSHAVFLLQKDITVAMKDTEPQMIEGDSEAHTTTSAMERQLKASALDYKERFIGHCNTTTDIKEANFLGPDARFVAAGSDDGSLYIWSRASNNIVRCLRGDESIVNCVQPHPATCLLATSGIEPVVRLWSPRPEDGSVEERCVGAARAAAAANQQRMRSDPFEAMLLNISFGGDREPRAPACRAT